MTQPNECSACGETKPPEDFPPRGKKCRACVNAYQREYRAKNPERIRQHDANSYARHREDVLVRTRAYYEANRETIAAKNRERYQNEDREAKNAQRRAWREANRHRAAEYTRRYREKNPLVTVTINQNRRTRIGNQKVALAELEALWTGACALCANPIAPDLRFPHPLSRSLDHIVPLAKGGAHVATNLQWTHLTCNRRKSDQLS